MVSTRFLIVFALVTGLSMVGIVFVLAKPDESPKQPVVLKEHTPIRSFIAVKDTDGNGIPDWKEVFSKETVMLDQVSTGPTTETGLFVSTLASRLMNRSTFPSSEQLVSDIGRQLIENNLDKQYTPADIKVSGDNSILKLREYGNKVASITFLEHPLPPSVKNELEILNRAFLYDDPKLLSDLNLIADAYEGMRDDMLGLTVPSSLVKEHLSLINVYQALAIDIRAFSKAFDDPLVSTLRFRRYPADADALYLAISNLYVKLHESGVQWQGNDTVSRFIEIES